MITHEKFAEKVIRECQKRSYMTYQFTQKEYFKQGKKHLFWNNHKCLFEFKNFIQAFNITIK